MNARVGLAPATMIVALAACGSDEFSWRSKRLTVVDTGTLPGVTASACHRGSLVGISQAGDGGSTVVRGRLVGGSFAISTSADTMPRGVSNFLTNRMVVQEDRLYIIDNRNDVRVWDVSGETPRLLGRYFDVPGDAYVLGEGYMLHADAAEGRIVDISDVAAPRTILTLRLRSGNTVTGVRSAARRGNSLVLLATDGYEFHRFAWSDVLAAAARPDLPSNILEDWYPVERQVSRYERSTLVDDGRFMVANTVGDPTNPADVKTSALPAVIDPSTGALLTDEGPDQQANNLGIHYEHATYVRPVPRGGEWFQIGPGLTGFWSEIVHVDLAAMVDGASAESGVSPILVENAVDYTDLCWFPDESFGYSIRQYINQPWSIVRWDREP